MQVFKNYLKITKSYIPIILIYTIIFVGIAAMTTMSGNQSSSIFEADKAKIALINHDKETEFIQSFQKYIQDNADYIELKDNDQELRDALFFRKVDYIMIVPKDFTQDFLNDKDVKIETMDVPDSPATIYSKTLMNKYLNTAKIYLKTDIPVKDISKYIQEDLSVDTKVNFVSLNTDDRIQKVSLFYNFSNYTLLAIIIAVVSMVMISFKEERIHRRNIISGTSYKSLNRQLLLGNVMTALSIWLLYVIVSIILYRDTVLSSAGILMIINAFIFTLFVLVFSFFLVNVTHNREVVSGISTVAGLGTSFIAGAFVPQELLSPFVLLIAKFTPSYWFITNNNAIAKLSSFTLNDLQPIIINMGVILGFTVLFYLLIQFISYLKLKS